MRLILKGAMLYSAEAYARRCFAALNRTDASALDSRFAAGRSQHGQAVRMRVQDLSLAAKDRIKIGVVIPCFRVRRHIVEVVKGVINAVDLVYVVDDNCPESSGQLVLDTFEHEKLRVIRHEKNQGVGGAVISGYRAALADICDIVIKMDGDGQMDPARIPALVAPIVAGRADYTKGNRFYALEYIISMPSLRILGNSILSFVNKASSGYWHVMDPTNGFTAIHSTALRMLPLDKIARRYFFESDMLFRLYTIRAVIKDVPMQALYADEQSGLKIHRVVLTFPSRYMKNFLKRFFYCYMLRDVNAGTIETIAGMALVLFGTTWGLFNWISYGLEGRLTPLGTIIVSALPIILGSQLLLAALSFDIFNVPKEPLQSMGLIDHWDHSEDDAQSARTSE